MKRNKIIVFGIAFCFLAMSITAESTETSKSDYQMPQTLPFGDPDGPLEGGLDDPFDWIYLGMTGVYGIIAVTFLRQNPLQNIEYLRQYIGLLGLGMAFTGDVIICLGEAFDIIDYDGDNY